MDRQNCKNFCAGIVQMRATRSIDENVAAAERQIREAVARGADYVLTPENTNVMELDKKRLLGMISFEKDCSVLGHFRALARELGIFVHLGSITVKYESDRIANRSFLIAPSGDVLARYDKIHMFDVDLPDGESYRESRTYHPGETAVARDLPWGRIGLTICYDLRFAALYRRLAQAGADFLTVPAAFTRQTGKAHWHVLLRARAIETGCFVLAAAQGGTHENGRETFGHSLVVAPWGEVIAEAGTEPEVLIVEIDSEQVGEARRRIPSLTHDRTYALDAPDDTQLQAAS